MRTPSRKSKDSGARSFTKHQSANVDFLKPGWKEKKRADKKSDRRRDDL